ncbi:MAG: DUF255 domain-containing protein [Bacteroidales bacterium]|nr:DUF255 domain-containing protein [Bacteroidales bacterium]
MRKLIIIILLFFSITNFAQIVQDSVNWITIEKAGELFSEKQKPILFYFYQDKCDSCRLQEKTTFSNSEVANYINILFYPVKINAETKDSIKFFDGNYYKNSGKNGKVHDLVFQLSGIKDTFPTIVIFSKRAEGKAYNGFKDRDEIFRILIYYSEDVDVTTAFDDWYKYHKKGYPPGQKQIITRLNVRWRTLEEANELNNTAPKKMLLNFYNYNKISCTLMRTQTYNHPKIAQYLNEKFYTVNIDIFSQDTMEIKGVKYINENQPYKYHQLPIAALEGKMIFPAFIVLDEEGNVLGKIQQYMTPEKFEEIIKFYGEDAFKKETFKAFKKKFISTIN